MFSSASGAVSRAVTARMVKFWIRTGRSVWRETRVPVWTCTRDDESDPETPYDLRTAATTGEKPQITLCIHLDHVTHVCLIIFQHLWGRETRLRGTSVSRFVISHRNNHERLWRGKLWRAVVCVSVDGGWCEWADWTPCSKTCGIEWVSRYRSCACPEPRSGGAPCSEQQEERAGLGVQIQRQPCPSVSFCPGNTQTKHKKLSD